MGERSHRERLIRHLVLLDTNVLYSPDPSKIVKSEVVEFILSGVGGNVYSLVIPELVRNELVFKLCSTLEKSSRQLDSAASTIRKLSGYCPDVSLDLMALRENVACRVAEVISRMGGTVEPTPYSDIGWEKIVAQSVQRRPPFAPVNEDRPSERGFRDAVISESVRLIATRVPDQVVAFITDDVRLRDYFATLTPTQKNLVPFDSLASFGNYLELERGLLDKTFAAALWTDAALWFSGEGERNSLFDREDLQARIERDFAVEFAKYTPGGPRSVTAQIAALYGGPWIAQRLRQCVFFRPLYVGSKRDGSLEWQSEIHFVQHYLLQSPKAVGDYDLSQRGMVRILKFQIDWHSEVTDEGRLLRSDLDDIAFKDGQLRETIDVDYEMYSLRDV